MDRREALKAYAEAVSREREKYLEQRALQKAGRMTAPEKNKYLQSEAFENAVYQLQRRDKVYQALRKEGTPIPQNDMWIAASALENGADLATCDAHFRHVPMLTVIVVD